MSVVSGSQLCELSVVSCREDGGRQRARLTTVVRTGNVQPRTAVRALRGSGCAEVCGLASRLNHALSRAWSRGFRETVIPAKDPHGDALG